MISANFEIRENRYNGSLTMCLGGELDLASAPVLARRLSELEESGLRIRLDLSRLEFVDSSGIHVLVRAFRNAREHGQRLEMDPELLPQVRRVFALVRLEALTGAPTPRGD